MSGRRVAILGAGPAGLGAAHGLARRGFDVHVVEATDRVGGNAGSFELAGLRVDYGSHRLHPASDPAVLQEIRELLGSDLLERPRHGRIRLLGRWIHFPLRSLDLALRLHPRFALGVAVDLLRKALPAPTQSSEESFASVLERGLGRTICGEFYFPYGRKLWGVEPEMLSAIQARKRVSAGSMGKMLQRLLPRSAGSGAASSKGIFFYPRHGFGQICERLWEASEAAGARLTLNARVARVTRMAGGGFEVEARGAGQTELLRADHVWSTIPSSALAGVMDPPVPDVVLEAARRLKLRAMVLVYLVLDTDRFSEYDAHYFPGAEIGITRLSEPKNYTDLSEPQGRTVLCAELPCFTSDPVWSMAEDELGRRVLEDLAVADVPVSCPVLEVSVRRLPAAYPVYREGYEVHLDGLDTHLDGIDSLLTFGRQGLFAHDNVHHALLMGRAAVDCLRDDGSFDDAAWANYRKVFETHVVED